MSGSTNETRSRSSSGRRPPSFRRRFRRKVRRVRRRWSGGRAQIALVVLVAAVALLWVGAILSTSDGSGSDSVLPTPIPSRSTSTPPHPLDRQPPDFTPRDPGFTDMLAYDNFGSRPDGQILGTVADSGHHYDEFYGTRRPYVVDGAYRMDPAAPWAGWSFATLREEREPTAVGARFFFDRPRQYGAQVVLALWRPSSSVARASVQFASSPTRWEMIKVIDGRRIWLADGRGKYATPLAEDGTAYEMSMHLNPSTSTVTAYLPDGSVESWTDPDYARFWGSTFATQIIRTNHTGDAGVTAMFSGT